MAAEDSITKVCGECHKELPLSAFHKNPRGVNGVHSKCKSCKNKYSKARYAERKDYFKEWREARPDYWINWRKANPELVAKYQTDRKRYAEAILKYRRKNREKINAKAREYRKLHPEYGRLASNRYHARKRMSVGTYTLEDINSLLLSQGGKCVACRQKMKKYHIDHIVPISGGGSNDKTNLQLLCPSCNSSKGAKDPIKFMQSRGFLL